MEGRGKSLDHDGGGVGVVEDVTLPLSHLVRPGGKYNIAKRLTDFGRCLSVRGL